jgi:uncharacterized DUF497 family protein
MEFKWDEAKRLSNLVKHALDFAEVARLDWARLKIERDWRFDYGEARFIGVGYLDDELVATAFTLRGAVVRIMSFRPASRKERARYGT